MTNRIKAVVSITVESSHPFVLGLINDLGIKPVYELSGIHDMMCIVDAQDISSLNKLIDKIKHITGVRTTNTSIILKEISN